jgi:predicted short-subunit dehydrogenase-like oxidoreductase (DUF2520 family)
MISSISIIGAGNVGGHLAKRLHACGHRIVQIFSRTPAKAARLSELVGSQGISRLEDVQPTADLYILAITDDATESVTKRLSFLNQHQKLIVHTSGSVSSAIFEQVFDNYGIFYPLQTFSAAQAVDFERLPFCIYGNTLPNETALVELARSICPNVYRINDEQRGILHVTAVFANNFSNYLFSMAERICEEQQLPFELLLPLIRETVHKIERAAPSQVQTGPAVRGDTKTIARHETFLQQYPDYLQVYQLLTHQLQAQTKKQEG